MNEWNITEWSISHQELNKKGKCGESLLSYTKYLNKPEDSIVKQVSG